MHDEDGRARYDNHGTCVTLTSSMVTVIHLCCGPARQGVGEDWPWRGGRINPIIPLSSPFWILWNIPPLWIRWPAHIAAQQFLFALRRSAVVAREAGSHLLRRVQFVAVEAQCAEIAPLIVQPLLIYLRKRCFLLDLFVEKKGLTECLTSAGDCFRKSRGRMTARPLHQK